MFNTYAFKQNSKKIKERTKKLLEDIPVTKLSTGLIAANTIKVKADSYATGGNTKSTNNNTKATDKNSVSTKKSTGLTIANTKKAGLDSKAIGVNSTALKKSFAATKVNNGALKTAIGLIKGNSAALVKDKVKKKINAKVTKLLATAQWVLNGALAAGVMLKTMGAGTPIVVAAKAMGKSTTISGIAGGKVAMAAMATGGVVSAPTVALVGEGRYPEAVVPLGSSPQFASMKTDIANAVLQGMMAANASTRNRSRDSSSNNEIVLNVDGTRLAMVMLPRLNKEQSRFGYNVTPKEV